jgi:hypothetical protein
VAFVRGPLAHEVAVVADDNRGKDSCCHCGNRSAFEDLWVRRRYSPDTSNAIFTPPRHPAS